MPKGRPKTKTAIVQLRVPPQLKAAAEVAAERDHRSLTGFIEVLILNHCKTHDIPITVANQETTAHEEERRDSEACQVGQAG